MFPHNLEDEINDPRFIKELMEAYDCTEEEAKDIKHQLRNLLEKLLKM